MSRRAWAWGAGVLVLGAIVLAAGLHSTTSFSSATDSSQTATLGQVMTFVLGLALLVVGLLVLGTGLRRRLEVRRRRRLWDRMSAELPPEAHDPD